MSMIIFLTALLIFSQTLQEPERLSHDDVELLIREAEQISEILMTEGLPQSWNASDVQKPGVRTDGALDMEKMAALKGIDYYNTKLMFGINSDYFIVFRRQAGDHVPINGSYGIGYGLVNATQTSVDFDSISPDNLAHTSRVAVLDRHIVRIEVYTWN